MVRKQAINGELTRLIKRMKIGCPGAMLEGIGLDIESNRSIDPKAARFFLTDSEQEWLKKQPAAGSAKTLLRLWTVKEAVFKADSDNTVNILGDYVLEDPAEWMGTARRRDGTSGRFHYTSIQFDEGFLSIAAVAKGDRDA